ncbi:MAG: aminotransferase class I/II-fold pyridoxal phosphate-dependent enzyme [Acidobacteria bacterium]|nr:aminotransferase class I/II-fold pyridoxal phosphate-dependent enzyme [Acidobacteriota bacterium]
MAVTHGGNIFTVARQYRLPWKQVLDFSASINPLGPSPQAREAILSAIDSVIHYPHRTAQALSVRLADEWQTLPENVLAGNGATELLFDWCRHTGPGTIAAPAFGEFHRAWPNAPTCLLADAATWPAEGPIVFTRPANPTGVLIDAGIIANYAMKRSDPVLVDESFLDFCDAESLVPRAKGNLFVLRSLTKFWALPGLRIGALIGDVQTIRETRAPWTVNVLAEAAALASVEDHAHAERTRNFIRAESRWFAGELAGLPGLNIWPAVANFLYIETERAAELTAFAAGRGVLIRDCSNWPGLGGRAIRVAVRNRWENETLLALLKECLCA